MKTKGFTLMEVVIACSVLSLFMAGVISLYSSGSKISNTTMWLQNVNSQLKNAARHINTSIRKSSYPSKIDFPKTIVESRKEVFNVKYKDGELRADSIGESSDTDFLQTIESTPAKTGGNNEYNQTATVIRHVYSLNKKGNLIYSQYISENINANSIDANYSALPSGTPVTTVLVKDVESVHCERKGDTKNIEVKIKCAMPKHSETTREEIAVGTSNVEISKF